MELHEGGKKYIKSKINWTSDCEYQLIVKESNMVNTPISAGSTMFVKIRKVKKQKVFYTSTFRGRSWDGKLLRQPEQVISGI